MKSLPCFIPPLPSGSHQLQRSFFLRDPEIVAQSLLGCGIAYQSSGIWRGGWIVETEAYLAESDPACHAARGRSRSNASMFAAPGTLYVYPIHAKFCANLVTQDIGVGSAVLVRAIEPRWGVESMRSNRSTDDPRRITSGPGMICQAMNIRRDSDGLDALSSDVWAIFTGHDVAADVIASPRIGVSRAAELPLRYFVNGNRYVSGPARLHTRPRRSTLD